MRDTFLPHIEAAVHWRQDLRSKLIDGLLAGALLALLLCLVVLLIRPVQVLSGRPGLFIYTISLMAISVYCLEHSLVTRYPDTTRAWYGLTGGLLAWVVVSLSSDLGFQNSATLSSLLLLILIGLIVTRLWRRHMPLGLRFYSLALLLSWSGQLLILGEPVVLLRYPLVVFIFKALALIMILAGFVTVGWMFTQTDRRLQRLSAAPWLAFFAIVTGFLLS